MGKKMGITEQDLLEDELKGLLDKPIEEFTEQDENRLEELMEFEWAKEVYKFYRGPVKTEDIDQDGLSEEKLRERLKLHKSGRIRKTTIRIVVILLIIGGLLWTTWRLFHGLIAWPNFHIISFSNKAPKIDEYKKERSDPIYISGSINKVPANEFVKINSYSHAFQVLNTIIFPLGKELTMVLLDSTLAFMDSNSFLAMPPLFCRDKREIAIYGNAFVRVKKDSLQRPFIIYLPGCYFKMVNEGAFYLNAFDTTNIKITVTKGTGAIFSAKAEWPVRPGKTVYININERCLDFRPVDTSLQSWTKGKYILQNSSIEDVISVFTNWFGRRVTIDDPELMRKRFTATVYKKSTFEEYMQFLNQLKGIGYYEKGEYLHLFSR